MLREYSGIPGIKVNNKFNCQIDNDQYESQLRLLNIYINMITPLLFCRIISTLTIMIISEPTINSQKDSSY